MPARRLENHQSLTFAPAKYNIDTRKLGGNREKGEASERQLSQPQVLFMFSCGLYCR